MRDSTWSVPGSLYEVEDEQDVYRTDDLLENAFKTLPGTSWAAKLGACNKCNCCTRHQTFRPAALRTWVELPSREERRRWYPDELGKCECNCRHMARFICRQVEEDGSMNPCPLAVCGVLGDTTGPNSTTLPMPTMLGVIGTNISTSSKSLPVLARVSGQ
jgi:hypothetical protein